MGSSIIDEARNLYDKSPSEVKDLAYRFFKSLDTDDNGRVDFQEIQSFLHSGNFFIGPYHEHTLFNELDRNHDNSLDFDEFITFFYIVFLRARCDRCNKCLIGKRRRTCVKCFMSANNSTYDVCRSCFYTHRNKHHHPRSELKNFEELVFNGNVPGHHNHGKENHATTNNGTEEPPRKQFDRLYISLQVAAIAASLVPVVATAAGCSIM